MTASRRGFASCHCHQRILCETMVLCLSPILSFSEKQIARRGFLPSRFVYHFQFTECLHCLDREVSWKRSDSYISTPSNKPMHIGNENDGISGLRRNPSALCHFAPHPARPSTYFHLLTGIVLCVQRPFSDRFI